MNAAPYQLSAFLKQSLQNALQKRVGLISSATTTCFRLLSGRSEQIPGLFVDWYDGYLVFIIYEEEFSGSDAKLLAMANWYQSALANYQLALKGVYCKPYPKDRSRYVDDKKNSLYDSKPFWGAAAPEEFWVLENNYPLKVRLYDGFSTGVFMDQRQNRTWLQHWLLKNGASQASEQPKLRVLNLFCYTGAFSVAACRAAGLPANTQIQTVNVDISPKYLEWCQQNIEYNIAADSYQHHQYLQQNFFEVNWARLVEAGGLFDLIILDPPSFGHHGPGGKPYSFQKDWPHFLDILAPILKPQGLLFLSTNLKTLNTEQVAKRLGSVGKLKLLEPQKIAEINTPVGVAPDFASEPERLKTFLLGFS